MIRQGDVYRIKSSRGTGTMIVVVVDVPNSTRAGVNCMIIGGDSVTYPVGSPDVFMFFRMLTDKVDVK